MYEIDSKVGPYRLIKPLGQGAFGTVWLGEKRTALTVTQVAVKIPHTNIFDFDAVAREASLWVKASGHPNVLPIIEADIYDGQLVIISEYASGGTLRELIRNQSHPFDMETTLNLIIGIMQGLQFLHERGIIHRDLKPTNILFQRDIPRIADFGISRLQSSQASSNVAGTFAYMAPEAFEGIRNVQTDIWAVGVMLYELLSLSLPFDQQDFPTLIKTIISHTPIPPLPAQTSFALSQIVSRALESNPQDRFSSAEEMLRDLRSDVVRFEMILRPRRSQDDSLAARKVSLPAPETFLPRPRTQHYAFSRNFLRTRAFASPLGLVEGLQKESGKGKLEIYWGINATECATDEPYILPAGLDRCPIQQDGFFRGVIITMPKPLGNVEAFFVGVVLCFTNPPDEEEFDVRYFTLDLGKGERGDLRTVLSEWGEHGHIYSEVCAVSNINDFRQEIKNRLPDYSEPVVEWNNVRYPFHQEYEYTLRDGALLTDNEIAQLEDLVEEFTERGPITCAISSTDTGFQLDLFAKYRITRGIGTDLFLYLADNFFKPRGQSVSFI